MRRRALLSAALSSAAWASLGCEPVSKGGAAGKRRLVSLSPAITETLFAIGAGADLVGVSDYDTYPESVRKLPHAGSALTPGYEAIARLAPTLILCEAAASAPQRELAALGVTRFLAWLSLEDIVASTRLLGALTDHAPGADALATRLWENLAVAEVKDGPRVLVVLGEGTGKLSEIFFIKRNSIHGSALRAAGARNAVAVDVPGVPRLSIEELLHVDPEAIIVLVAATADAPSEARALADYGALEPLTAHKNGRISVLRSESAFVVGPRILTLAEQLRNEVARLFPGSAQAR